MLASLSEPERVAVLSDISEEKLAIILHDWRFWARPEQLAPGSDGAENSRTDWTYWLLQAGRGFGKTRCGAEWVRETAESNPGAIIHLIGATGADVRDVMIQGESGLLSCYPENAQPLYEPSKRLVTFKGGATVKTFSAEEPERLRGPQCHFFWADEVGAWKRGIETWDNLLFGFRLGVNPQGVITTTPKPVKLIRDIVKDPNTVVTRGSSYDNRANLATAFFQSIIRKYEGTRLGRQELLAELLEDIPGALWTRALIEANRVLPDQVPPYLVRVVVAIDPAVSAHDESDETGIGVVGLAENGHCYVFKDLTLRDTPLAWGNVAIAAYRTHLADRIVGEVNNGGDLVARNIQAIDASIPFRAVHASRGKAIRAEPVAALYEQGRVHHVIGGELELLEDQMCGWVPGSGEKSPDRMDWLVWAITDLVLDLEVVEETAYYDSGYQISPV